MASSDDSTLVLVTGISGYIASHVAQLLLREGYRVRGTVRNLTDTEMVEWLRQLCPDANEQLDLVQADLLKEESWTDAVKDCQFVIHVASPFPNQNLANAEEELIKPAVEGTKFVLQACAASKTVRRVVLTSSIAAVHGEMAIEDGKVYNEEDWTNADSPYLDNYSKSKTLAEKAAWDFVKELSDDDKFELCVVNPGVVIGPLLSNKNVGTSMEIVKRMLDRSMPAIPKANFAVCDVRDVAMAHYKAMTIPDAAGHRHIITTQNLWLREMAQILAKELKPQGYGISTLNCPYFALWVKGFFDKSIKLILPRVGKEIKYDNDRMKSVLGIEPMDATVSLLDAAYSLIENGVVKKTKKYHGPNKPAADGEKAGTSEDNEEGKQNGNVVEPEEVAKETKEEEEEEDIDEVKKRNQEKLEGKIEDNVDTLKKDVPIGDCGLQEKKLEKLEVSGKGSVVATTNGQSMQN